MQNKIVKCGKLSISNTSQFTLIAGPCQLENEKHALKNNGNEVLKFYWIFPTNSFSEVEYFY